MWKRYMILRNGEQFSSIVGILAMLLPGIVFLFRPDIPIKWAKTTRPTIDEGSTFVKLITRIIGAGFICIGLIILIMTIWLI